MVFDYGPAAPLQSEQRETAKPGHMKMTEAVRGRIAEAKTALVEILVVCGLVRPKTQKR